MTLTESQEKLNALTMIIYHFPMLHAVFGHVQLLCSNQTRWNGGLSADLIKTTLLFFFFIASHTSLIFCLRRACNLKIGISLIVLFPSLNSQTHKPGKEF